MHLIVVPVQPRSNDPELVRLIVGGQPGTATIKSKTFGNILSVWESYRFDNDLFTPADSFSFKLGLTGSSGRPMTKSDINNLINATKPDTVVRLEVGENNDLAAIGIIDDQFIHGDRGGDFIELAGRDGMSILLDNEADQKNCRLSNTTLPDMAAKMLARYQGKGIPFIVQSDNNSNRNLLTGKKKPITSKFGSVQPRSVRTSLGTVAIFGKGVLGPQDVPNDFVRLPIAEARPHAGETEYAYLERHAGNLGVMMWMSADGNLIFSRPDYNQEPLFSLYRYLNDSNNNNNILSGGARRNTANSATSVKLLGHTEGRGDDKTQVRAQLSLDDLPLSEVARLKGIPVANITERYTWPRLKVIRDAHAKDKTRANKEAHRALSRANTNLLTLEYEVRGHSQNGILYCPDTLVTVIDEVAGISGTFYITSRSISKDKSGTHTNLKLVPSGTIILE